MSAYIDPEELPFTTAELQAAARTFLSEDEARLVAESLTELGPRMVRERSARRVAWKAAHIANADALPLHGWVYPDELLGALAALSVDSAARVERLRRLLARDDRGPAV